MSEQHAQGEVAGMALALGTARAGFAEHSRHS